ncbi:MAG: NAD(P)-dependent alcohol dehydrogenase [Clostridiales Family XIII bacterium]|jgi:L-iditol 2-dehydrogenase|nr:NAD(P)-dependent alcohol dehydrogenase [Clostridiales Family XIII bacterium]
MPNEKMKVAVMTGLGEMEFVERPVPSPADDEVLVKLEYVGVCGSDLHYYELGAIGDFVVEPPFVLGHECAGTVVEIGKGVTDLKKGDRVALEPGITCGKCEFCKTGRYNLCPDVIFFATPPVDGVFQEYVAHKADLCFKLPDNVSTLEGALIEPLAVGFHAANQSGGIVGQTAVVMGAGCIGLMSLLALKARSVSTVVVVDVMPKRLDKALEIGADAAINAKEKDVTAEILNLTGGKGADVVIDAAGSEATFEQGVDCLKKGGTLVFVGYTPDEQAKFPVNVALNKELDLKTVFRYRNIYPMAIEAVAGGKIDLKSIVTKIYPFDDVKLGMDESVKNKADIVKSVIQIA